MSWHRFPTVWVRFCHPSCGPHASPSFPASAPISRPSCVVPRTRARSSIVRPKSSGHLVPSRPRFHTPRELRAVATGTCWRFWTTDTFDNVLTSLALEYHCSFKQSTLFIFVSNAYAAGFLVPRSCVPRFYFSPGVAITFACFLAPTCKRRHLPGACKVSGGHGRFRRY
jgi:hypothetical protein